MSATRNSVWHWLTCLTLVGATPFSTAQTRVNWINVLMFKTWYKQLINIDSSLLACAKAGISLQHNHFICRSFQPSHLFLTELKGDINMVASYYCIVPYLQHCYASQCSTRLLKVLHKCCNMDVLGVLLIYPHSPLGAPSGSCVYISQTPCRRVTI